ncbi:hypothetical protein C6988_08560 [Nitrosopumilus sp. b1]|uniref:hypothetical protein n=1 Tax=Nitrosopumilus sp. b1 TaxID=2109907 RepID=UPI0015F6D591|nr:hypothetical protein [Nitrosopumilus sp. b1]KAF6242438.1 hypothetical protein C6988_08560 [Nitrosopumilus sp. b1]
MSKYGKLGTNNMTKMIQVNLETEGIDKHEAEEWVHEIANVYADMEVSDVDVSGKKISFRAGLSGMDDTTSEDIQQKIDEYITMNEAFQIKNISCS